MAVEIRKGKGVDMGKDTGRVLSGWVYWDGVTGVIYGFEDH
jgi:hypothetical protein